MNLAFGTPDGDTEPPSYCEGCTGSGACISETECVDTGSHAGNSGFASCKGVWGRLALVEEGMGEADPDSVLDAPTLRSGTPRGEGVCRWLIG
jgi:hypothetical protein